MESIFPKLAFSGSKNVCVRTNTVFFPISEVNESMVSLMAIKYKGVLSKRCILQGYDVPIIRSYLF